MAICGYTVPDRIPPGTADYQGMTGRSSPDLNQAPLGGKTSVPMTMMDFYFNNIHFLRDHNVYMMSKNMSRMPL